MLQRHINLWFSLSEDLFGGEISSNAADFFAAGLKGRYKEEQNQTDHIALTGSYVMDVPEGGGLTKKEVALRTAMNEVLRDEYVIDCQRAVDKWNRTLQKTLAPELQAQVPLLTLPHRRFHRHIGVYAMDAGHYFDPSGAPIDKATFTAHRPEWLPTAEDRAHLQSIMRPVHEPGKIAAWLAPPARGINGQAFEFEYVRH